MVRTQIQLTEEQAIALKRLAAKRRISIARLVRQGVEVLLRSYAATSDEERRRRAIAVAGRFIPANPTYLPNTTNTWRRCIGNDVLCRYFGATGCSGRGR